MKDKRGLVMGVANDKSIGWGIAKAIADQGGEHRMENQNHR